MVTTESLAIKVRTSAQETMPGHSASRRLFTLSMKSKPLSVWFGIAFFSGDWPEVEFRSRDASHPWKANFHSQSLDSTWHSTVASNNEKSEKNSWSLIRWDTYPDKAIMEVHSNEGGGQWWGITDVLFNIVSHNLLSFRTALSIKIHLQLSMSWAYKY